MRSVHGRRGSRVEVGDRDALVSSISHSLKGPLQTIVGLGDLLEQGNYGDLSPEQRRAAARIVEQSEELVRRMDAVVALADLGLEDAEEGGRGKAPPRVRPSAVADAAGRRLAAELEERGMRLRNEIPTDHPAVLIPASRLLRLFQMLIRYVALEAGRDAGAVVLRARPPGEDHGTFSVAWALDEPDGTPADARAGPDEGSGPDDGTAGPEGASGRDAPDAAARPIEPGPGSLELVVALRTLAGHGGGLELTASDRATSLGVSFTLPRSEAGDDD